MAAIKIKGQIWNGPIAKNYWHGMFSYHAKYHAFIIEWIIVLPVSLTIRPILGFNDTSKLHLGM